jgi:hypothetical protein
MEVKRIAKNRKNALAHGFALVEFGSKASCFTDWEDHLSIRKNPNGITYDPNASLISQEQYDKAMAEWEKNSPRNYKAFKNWERKNSK